MEVEDLYCVLFCKVTVIHRQLYLGYYITEGC